MQQGVLCRFIIYTPQTVHRQGARSKIQNQNYIGLVVKAARHSTTTRVRFRPVFEPEPCLFKRRNTHPASFFVL